MRQLILSFDHLPARASREIIHTIDLATAAEEGWTFLMINPQQNAAVVGWLARHSSRKGIAAHLWAEMLTATDHDTGEVLLSRQRTGRTGRDAPQQRYGRTARAGGDRRHRPTP